MIDLFTKQERIFIGFLLFGILVGAGIELYRSQFRGAPPKGQSKEIDVFEKTFFEKAKVIDSLLAERTLSVSHENYAKSSQSVATVDSRSRAKQAAFRVEINHASIDELVSLPQIGRVIATRIVDYRSAHGAFKNIEEIMNVKGIGEKKFKAIRPYIYIEEN